MIEDYVYLKSKMKNGEVLYFFRDEHKSEPFHPKNKKILFEKGQNVGVLWPTGKETTEEINLEDYEYHSGNLKHLELWKIKVPYISRKIDGIEGKIKGKEFEKLKFLKKDLKTYI